MCPLPTMPAPHIPCMPEIQPVLRLWASRAARLVVDARPVLVAFADSTVVYIVAKQWADLLAIYIFELQPRPFCVGAASVCGQVAPAWEQFLYSIGVLVLCVPIRRMCSVSPRESLRNIPAMASQWVGWSIGAASVQLLGHLDASASLSECSACNTLNLLFVLVTTIITALAVVWVGPRVPDIVDPDQSAAWKLAQCFVQVRPPTCPRLE